MTVFKNYDTKGELINEVDEPVSPANLDKFQAVYTTDYVQGYKQALADFEKEVEAMLWKKYAEDDNGESLYDLNGPGTVRTKLVNWHRQKEDLLKSFDSSGITLQKPLDFPNPMQD